ncbi:hypothetical protein ACQRIU_001315 [Beauveria bassiana]
MSDRYDLGLDAGTYKTCIYAGGKPVAMQYGFPTSDSVVRISPRGSFAIPSRAQLPSVQKPDLALCKRLIGRSPRDGRLRHDTARVPHAKLDENGAYYEAGGRRVELFEVWAFILGSAKRAAERKFGEPPRRSVLTVPAYFGINQCEAIRAAAKIAGFDMESTHLVTEPVAVAVDQIEHDYGTKKKYPAKSKLGVIDIGGGTTDITELYCDLTGEKHVYVIQAIEGNNFLGGVDFKQRLYTFVTDKARDAGHTYEFDEQKLLIVCENAMETLTGAASAEIELIATDQSTVSKFITVTRDEFEKACADLLTEISGLIDRLPAAKANRSLAAVLLAGGASQMPCIKELCVRKFPETVIKLVRDASESPARGAEQIAKRKDTIVVHDVLSRSIGVEVNDSDSDTSNYTVQQVASRNMRVPARERLNLFTRKDNQSAIEITFLEGESSNPDDNTRIAAMTIFDIPNCKRGTKINVDLEIHGQGSFIAKATIKGLTDELTVVPQQTSPGAGIIEKYRDVTARRLDGESVKSPDITSGPDASMNGDSSSVSGEDVSHAQRTSPNPGNSEKSPETGPETLQRRGSGNLLQEDEQHASAIAPDNIREQVDDDGAAAMTAGNEAPQSSAKGTEMVPQSNSGGMNLNRQAPVPRVVRAGKRPARPTQNKPFKKSKARITDQN